MNGHFMGFPQLVQKLERITPIISTLQDKQNESSFYGFSSTGLKAKTKNTNHFYSSRQKKLNGLKIRINNTNALIFKTEAVVCSCQLVQQKGGCFGRLQHKKKKSEFKSSLEYHFHITNMSASNR